MKHRLIGPDVLRALAVVCVIGGHFFAINTPFNDTPFVGPSMFIQGWLKSFMQGFGVPMFLMLSGYFCCTKEFSLKYYKGITKVLYSYIFVSIVTWGILSAGHSPVELLLGVLGYKTIGYAWYIEMYIGLFLLIPLINIVLAKIFENKCQAQIMLLILAFLFSFPTAIDRGQYKLVPAYWLSGFPVLCYCMGAYIRHFQPTLRRRYLAISIAFVISAISPCFSLCYNTLTGGDKTYFSVFGAYYSIPYLIMDFLLFLSLYKTERLPKQIEAPITSIALSSLEIFLFSYMFDQLLYPLVMQRFYVDQSSFLIWFAPMVLIILFLSWLTTQVKNIIFRILHI